MMRKKNKLQGLFVALLLVGGMVLSVNAADHSALNELSLSVSDCNIVVEFSADGQYRYEYDPAKFTVEQTTTKSTAAIAITPKSKENAKQAYMDENQNLIFDVVRVYIPKQSYETVNIFNERAGIRLPELYANINYTDNAGAVTIPLPDNFDKTLNFSSVKGAGTLVMKENLTDFIVSTTSKDSVLSLPKHFPPHTSGAPYRYQQGNGNAEINIDLQNCAFTLAQSSAHQPTDATAVRNKALIYLNTDNANHMATEMNVVTLDAYLVNNNNYFKLRDIAYVLNRTNLNFNVDWDKEAQSIEIKTETPYLPIGDETSPSSPDADKTKGVNLQVASEMAKLSVNGKAHKVEVYHIDGYHYFKLRDLGDLLDFHVNWLENEKAVQLLTESKS